MKVVRYLLVSLTIVGFVVGVYLIGYQTSQKGSPSLQKASIPEVVKNRYKDLADRYGKSMGASLTSCTLGTNGQQIYIITGDGGYTGVTYYLTKDGELIGEDFYSDIISENKSAALPFDIDDLNCSLLESTG